MGQAKRRKARGEYPAQTARLGTADIRLDNPVREHFAKFIFANALKWEVLAHDELIRCNPAAAEALEPFEGILGFVGRDGRKVEAQAAHYQNWLDFRTAVAEHCEDTFVVGENSAKGQHVVICGAGPTLADHVAEWVPQGHQVWGVNSALPYLVKHSYPVTHGLTVDQTPEMCAEWFSAPDVEYLLATTVHPHLTEYLQQKGRRIRFFNNFVGIKQRPVPLPRPDGTTELMPYEDWLYSVLFHSTVRCGSGLNSVTRAVDLALFMGFEQITVLGADCALQNLRIPDHVERGSPEHIALLRGAKMHADGGDALASNATPLTFGGDIDGKHWETKPDMAISAVWLMRMERALNGRMRLIGDTLPNALKGKSDEFLNRLPTLVDSVGVPIPIEINDGNGYGQVPPPPPNVPEHTPQPGAAGG